MLREHAYRRFKTAMYDGEIAPGQFLSIRELCEKLDVSLAPMRDAVGHLELEGLIKLIPKRGVQVSTLDRQFIRNTFQVRRMLETQACREVIENGNMGRLDEIHELTLKIIKRAEHEITDGILRESYEIDWMLHNELIQLLGNDQLTKICELNNDKIRITRLNARFTKDRVLPAMKEHLKVTSALVAGDGNMAAIAMERHIQISERRALGAETEGLV